MTKQKNMKKPRRTRAGSGAMLAVYTVGHLSVEICSWAALYAFTIDTDYFSLSLLLYGVCALALRLPIGALADRASKTGGYAIFGCVMIAAAMIAVPAPLVLASVLGIGNACYYVGGCVFAVRKDNKCTPLGIFTSPAVVGMFAGRYIAGTDAVSGGVLMISTAVIMILCAFLVVIFEPVTDTYESVAPFPKGLTVSYPVRDFMACVCFFLASGLCTFAELSFNFERVDGIEGCALTAAAALGIVIGGILADRIGVRSASSLTLLISALLMVFSGVFLPFVFAVMLFGMTVPMMLRAAANVCGRHKGASLGMMSLAAFIGYLPTVYDIGLPFGVYGNAAVVMLTLAIFAAGLEFASRRMKSV